MRESDEQKARRLMQQMLQAAGWAAAELRSRAKGDEQKVRIV